LIFCGGSCIVRFDFTVQDVGIPAACALKKSR
jgi:hypothetical protein